MKQEVYQRMETIKVITRCVWGQYNADGKFVDNCTPCQHRKAMCAKLRKLIDGDLNRLRKSINNKYERLKKNLGRKNNASMDNERIKRNK